MNAVPRPALNATDGDDLDRTLRAFFQAELPDPWPEVKRSTAKEPSTVPFPTSATSRAWLLNSRLALAAAVALLVIGHAFLSDALKPSHDAEGGLPAGVSASPRIPGVTPGNRLEHPPGGLPDEGDGLLPEEGMGKADGDPSIKVIESLVQDGDGPTMLRIDIIPNR